MRLKDHIVVLAEAYAGCRGISLSRLSTILFNDGKRLGGLRAGKDLTTGSYEHAVTWFGHHWPEGEPWPDDVPRPLVAQQRAAA